jgi:hypothetical protein
MQKFWWGVGSLATLGLIVLIVIWVWPNKPVISSKIKSQLTSTLLLPQDPRFKVEQTTIKFNKNLSLLTYYVSVFGHQVLMSEQPTPQSFIDIPQAYTQLVQGMNDYEDIDVSVGTVHLTTPKQLNGAQAAILNTDGTLSFGKPSGSLSVTQWRQYYDSFEVIH